MSGKSVSRGASYLDGANGRKMVVPGRKLL